MAPRGRPVGIPKTGGRAKGTPNRATAAKVRAIEQSGLTPLDYMLDVMRNPKAKQARRDWAASAAAPYVHPKLATLQSNVNLTGRLTLEALINASLPSPANDDTMKLIEGEVVDETENEQK